MPYFKLLMKGSLGIVVLLARVVVNLSGIHLLGILAVVLTLGQLNFLGSV